MASDSPGSTPAVAEETMRSKWALTAAVTAVVGLGVQPSHGVVQADSSAAVTASFVPAKDSPNSSGGASR